MTEWHPAGENNPEAGVRTLLIDGRMVMLTPDGGGWLATDAICPHKFANLADGTFGDGCVTCPQHEATFDLRTGRPGDGEGWAGQLPVHEVRVDDGQLMVRLSSY